MQVNQLESKLEIIAISIDTDEEEWKEAVYNIGLESWFNLSDLKGWNGEITDQLNIYATPTFILTDGKGQIIKTAETLEDLKDFL